MYDNYQDLSSEEGMATRKPITVRIPAARLQRLMRARKAKSQSELINTLLDEEEERLKSHQILKETSSKLKPADIDDRLL